MSDKDYNELVRKMLQIEDELINHRMTWLSTFNALLFAGAAFAWKTNNDEILIFLFSFVGIAVSSSIAMMLKRANVATDILIMWWDNNKPKNYDGPDVVGIRSKPGFLKCFEPGNFIPIVFIIAWLVLALIRALILFYKLIVVLFHR
jgi:hypothetical protein